MKLSDYYDEVARHADTPKTKINAADTRRVLAMGFKVMAKLDATQLSELLAKGLAAAAKKK